MSKPIITGLYSWYCTQCNKYVWSNRQYRQPVAKLRCPICNKLAADSVFEEKQKGDKR